MLKMTRLAMLATALVLAMPSALAPSVALAQGQPAPAATPATPRLLRPQSRRLPPAPRRRPRRQPRSGEDDRNHREPVRSRGVVEGRRPRRPDHARHPRHHVDGQLVRHHHQAVRAGAR